MNSLIEIAGVLVFLLLVGGAIGFMRRDSFLVGWLFAAAGLVFLNEFMLTRGFGCLPKFFPWAHWNWQGKALALVATLSIASLPTFGWRRSGLTFAQAEGSLKICIPVALLYCLFLVVMAYIFPDRGASPETMAFQLTMPGLEEELFFRGILLFALDRAFTARVRIMGVEWGWGAVLSCALFGLAHAFSFSQGHFSFAPLTMALTALPSFIAVWMRLRTGSLLLPVLLHNFGNSIFLLV